MNWREGLDVPNRRTVETLPSAHPGLMQSRPGCSCWKRMAGLLLSDSWWLMTCSVALSTCMSSRPNLSLWVGREMVMNIGALDGDTLI